MAPLHVVNILGQAGQARKYGSMALVTTAAYHTRGGKETLARPGQSVGGRSDIHFLTDDSGELDNEQERWRDPGRGGATLK
jgi:hypothetical protein